MPEEPQNMLPPAKPELAQAAPINSFFERDFLIRGVSLTPPDVDSLFDLLEQITAEALELEVEYALSAPNQNHTKDQLLEIAQNNFRVTHAIRDNSNNIGVSGGDKPDLNSNQVASEIGSLWVTNREFFEIGIGSRPANYVDIYIDFKRPSMAMNLLSFPSNPTLNGSCLNVKGRDERWVISTHQRLVEFFNQRKTSWAWLHGSGVYDGFIYSIVIPFLIFKAYQFETSPPDWFTLKSSVALVGLYMYALTLSLMCAKQIFVFSRWMFPAVEFASGKRRSPTIYRFGFATLVMGLLVWAIQNFISSLI